MNDYPFNFTIPEEALKSYPPEVQANIDAWLQRVRRQIHESLYREHLPYRQSFEIWKQLKEKEGD